METLRRRIDRPSERELGVHGACRHTPRRKTDGGVRWSLDRWDGQIYPCSQHRLVLRCVGSRCRGGHGDSMATARGLEVGGRNAKSIAESQSTHHVSTMFAALLRTLYGQSMTCRDVMY